MTSSIPGQWSTGTIVSVTRSELGDSLRVAAATGDTVLTVGDTSEFDSIAGGQLQVNGAVYDYVAIDEDDETVTLATGLLADADEGDRVFVIDAGTGRVAVEGRALVALPGRQANDDSIDADVAQALVPLLVDGLRDPGAGESVTMTERDGSWTVVDVHGKPAEAFPLLSRMSVSYDVPDITTWVSGGVGDWTIDEEVGSAFGIRAGSQIDMFEPGIYAVTLTLFVGGIDVASPDCSIRANVSLGTAPITYIGCGVRGGDEPFGVASASCTYYQPGTGDAGEIGCDIRVLNLDTVNIGFIGVRLAIQQVVR